MTARFWNHLAWKKLWGGLLFAVGWLLSPLCWWNDLIIIINLPVAYGFDSLCHWIAADWLLPGTIVGYWLSNLLGILLMQVGAIAVFQTSPQKRNLKQELLFGVVSSSIFTVGILLLIHFQILSLPALFAKEGATHSSVLGSVLWFGGAIAIWLGSVPGVLLGAKLCKLAPQRLLRFTIYLLLVAVSWKLAHPV